jgi:hypothetical protein
MWCKQPYIQCLFYTLYTAYIHSLHVLLCSICLRESFAPSTVYVLLLHVTMPSTVVHLLHATSCDSAYSTHPAQPTYIHFMCFSTVSVYVNHMHPGRSSTSTSCENTIYCRSSTSCYFMWQCHLNYLKHSYVNSILNVPSVTTTLPLFPFLYVCS